MLAGQQMDELWSANQHFLFAHQGDGNIVLYDTCRSPGDVLWNSGTEWAGANTTASLTDGGLTLSRDGNVLWQSGAAGPAGNSSAYLVVQNDGNVVIYDAGSALWATLWDPSFHWPEPCGAPTGDGGADQDVRLGSGDTLGTLTSPNGQFQLVFDAPQGNVILYGGGQRVWDMGASGGVRAVMQTDGNFVIYADAGTGNPLRWVNDGGHQGEGWYCGSPTMAGSKSAIRRDRRCGTGTIPCILERDHHSSFRRSAKNPAVGPFGASVASQMMVSAPSSTERGAPGPPMSVRTQPGQALFTSTPVPLVSAPS